MLASSYARVNSILRVAEVPGGSDNARMPAFTNQRRHRRERLALLLDEVGQTQLAERSGISPAYLYQMGKGNGSNARNVSDLNARKIEEAAGVPRGWLDSDTKVPARVAEPAPAGATVAARAASQKKGLDRAILVSSVRVVRRAITEADAETSDEGFADLVVSVYDFLAMGAALDAAEPIVAALLRAVGTKPLPQKVK